METYGSRKRNRGDGRDRINVVNINRDTARVWQPSAKIQRQHWQRQRYYYNDSAPDFNKNARVRRGDANDARRRLAAVPKPSLQDFDRRTGDGKRRGDGNQKWKGTGRKTANQTQTSNDSLSR